MSKLASFPGGLLLGAGLMYLLDPVRGRRRRARILEAVHHAERKERELFDKAARDARQRLHGLTERVKHRPSSDVPDQVIVDRVRSRLGRVVSHPRAVDVTVLDGRAILRGAIFAHEAAKAVAVTRSTPGVRAVIDRLEKHLTAGHIPQLQGQPRAAMNPAARESWSPSAQVGATGAGALLFAYGLLLKRGLVGTLLSGAGLALALRGTMNKSMPSLFGFGDAGKRTITVNKTITVHAPIHIVFDLWSRLDNFPLFMSHVREVDIELGGRRTRWIVDGPAGTHLEFEAETTAFEPDRVIAWKTLPKQSVEHEGRVRFEAVDVGTRVNVIVSYRPPLGAVGHAIAHILGWDPKARMDDDLARMKALLEDGKTRSHDGRVELTDLH
jgi:uncharacterized membrane protein